MKCNEITFGTYNCTYNIMLPCLVSDPTDPTDPTAPKSSKTVCIDKCLLPEIIRLWELGIKTTGCCCGHNKMAKKNSSLTGRVIVEKCFCKDIVCLKDSQMLREEISGRRGPGQFGCYCCFVYTSGTAISQEVVWKDEYDVVEPTKDLMDDLKVKSEQQNFEMVCKNEQEDCNWGEECRGITRSCKVDPRCKSCDKFDREYYERAWPEWLEGDGGNIITNVKET